MRASLAIHVNDVTKIFGSTSELTDIGQGQHVKILGYVTGENNVAAAQVKVEKKASAKVKLQGPITLINRPVISVLSVDLDTDVLPENGFETAEQGPVSRDEFFNQILKGNTVSTIGNLIGYEVEWEEIELLPE